jgi:ubiquinone/menaquinone biosynthesis C-methylase UbiE
VRAVRSHVDEIEIQPGESILDVGCGPGTLDRWLARRTKGANPIRAVDVNGYFLREAAIMAKAEGLADIITFGTGNAEDLPFPDNHFDVVMSHTVMEECDADKMLAQMIRVAKPGGRVAVMVRATDRRVLWNMPLDDAVRDIVEAPVPSVGIGGCADVSLYRRFGQSGLTDLRLFPTVMTVSDPDSYSWRYYEPYIFSQLDEAGVAIWHAAKAQAIADGSILMSRWAHCAVGTKKE